ncbi:hypothetical protein [Crenothrix polyspora]|uniref:Uncharacterized protein n=1 Tax=Crenothrix polyspora TaxID=360316 RepID=A0A1R4H2S6_9GAMM|nr:hypothetical protein [Crenothrix polyspora]SJM90524.1 hypothetical protein CRENPOLYSF1_150010 [Crenothrix polyspora]
MNTLTSFTEEEREKSRNRAREEYYREQLTIQRQLLQSVQSLRLALAQTMQREDVALAEIARLKALLGQ